MITKKGIQEPFDSSVVYGDANGHRHHATPMPDGHHWIAGVRICKADEDSTEIVGLQVTTATADEYTVGQQEGYMMPPAVCDEHFLLPKNDCIKYFNIAFDQDGAAVQFLYSSRLDNRVRAIGYGNGIQDMS